VSTTERGENKTRAYQLARRGGAFSAALGVVLALPIAGFVMRGALLDAETAHGNDVAGLLVSECTAAVALDDRELVQETLHELAPSLADLSWVRVLGAHDSVLGQWTRANPRGAVTHYLGEIHGTGPDSARIIGRVELAFSTERSGAALRRLWLYLGLIALASLGLSVGTALVVGRDMAHKARLESELQVARSIQTSLVPSDPRLANLEIAACMLPATEVGGDYYDVVATPDGGWICIGDAVGHGLPAGLLMVMLQSGIGTLLRERPDIRPREVIRTLNAMVFENTRRLGEPRYATLVAVRYAVSGRLDFAGGHLDLLLRRKSEQAARFVATPGSFVGLEEQLEVQAIEESSLELEPDDLLVLYTDGLTEARNADGVMYGSDRLARALDSVSAAPVAQVRDHLVAEVRRFMRRQDDDISLVVMRYRAVEAG
jgi:hypothetical protein